MATKESDIIAAEIKIGITSNSWSELQELIGKIREVCEKQDYKLSVNVEGNFFKQEAQSFIDAKRESAKKRNKEIDNIHRAIDWVTGRGNTYGGFIRHRKLRNKIIKVFVKPSHRFIRQPTVFIRCKFAHKQMIIAVNKFK